MGQKQLTDKQIECNYFWDAEEKQAFVNAGGGWDGIEAVVELDQRRFLNV